MESLGGPRGEKQTFTFLHTNVMRRRKGSQRSDVNNLKGQKLFCVLTSSFDR